MPSGLWMLSVFVYVSARVCVCEPLGTSLRPLHLSSLLWKEQGTQFGLEYASSSAVSTTGFLALCLESRSSPALFVISWASLSSPLHQWVLGGQPCRAFVWNKQCRQPAHVGVSPVSPLLNNQRNLPSSHFGKHTWEFRCPMEGHVLKKCSAERDPEHRSFSEAFFSFSESLLTLFLQEGG